MTLHQKVCQLADALVAETFIEFLRMEVERGNAKENVRTLSKDVFFSPLDHLSADAATAPIWMHGDGLDVTIQRAGEMQDQNADDLFFYRSDVDFASRVGQPLKRLLKTQTQCDPRFGRDH